MTRKLLVGAIVAGALTVTAGTAFALSQDDRSPSGAAPATTTSAPTSLTTAPTTSSTTAPTSSTSVQAKLTADDAVRIAQARYGGTVHEVESEVEHGRPEWKVELTTADGVTYDVRVDAVTGDLTRVDQDSNRDDGRDDDRDHDRGDDHGRHGGDDHGDDHDDD